MVSSWIHVPCPGCACVCDDLNVSRDDRGRVHVSTDCQLGQDWFRRHTQPESPDETPARCLGQTTSTESAIEQAAVLLNEADYPLIYGLSRSATPGQRAAVDLGEYLHGVVDTTASLCHGPSIMALQDFGEVTSTLGEIRNRADLVIFWGCNPGASHPRHAERYSVFPQGRHLPGKGRSDRTIVMVGDEQQVHNWTLDADGTPPDIVIPLPADGDFDAIATLRTMLNGTADQLDCDIPPPLQQLYELMIGCRYGVVFFGLGLAKTDMWADGQSTDTGHIDVAGLLKLVSDLNAVTRFTARRMRLQGDVSGADAVMLWQSGYPFGVDYSRGYPRYNPGEYTANELLERGDVDACLLVGAETVSFLSDTARERLTSIPTVVLDYPGTTLDWTPTVSITTAVYGIHAEGTIYRMDNVPLSARQLWTSPLPTDEQVLQQILQRINR